MNWNYISGFFDADGSVTLVTPNKGKMKTLQVSFHNNELVILEQIRNFIKTELGINGSISIKKPRKDTHNTSYDLKYAYFSALKILNNMVILHPKKHHRYVVYKQIQYNTPRNGKYTDIQLTAREQLEKKFFMH